MRRQILDKDYWNCQRQVLKNSYKINDLWQEVVARFKGRIQDFYFAPIDRVKDPKELKGEGFTILTIQCSLIEMFAAFKYGKIHKYNKRNHEQNYYYRKADECFYPFLHSEPMFENHFHRFENGKKLNDEPFSATIFYDEVRCGLVHEARTKGKWVVNAKKNYKGDEIIYITPDSTGERISIDRTILQKQLKQYFDGYIEGLLEDTDAGKRLRRLFARKLDHLYDISPDQTIYDWWEDHD